MTNSKLVQLLRTFSKGEFKSFGKFVRSPFFYKDKAVSNLYESFNAFYPAFNDKNLTKEYIFNKVYRGKVYSDTLMKYLMSEMFSMGKKFLAYINFEKDFFEQDIRLLKELNSRNISKIFESQLEKSDGKVKNYPIRNEAYYNQMYLLQREINAFYSYSDRLSVKRDAEKLMRYQINGFLISILKSYYIFLSDQGEYDVKFNFDFLDIGDIIDKNKNIIEPSALVFYNIFMLRYKNEHTYFDNLQNLKNEYINMLDNEIKEYIYESMDNYCVQKIAEGNVSFYDTLFSLSNDELISGVRFNWPLFSYIFFMNKVEVAAKVKEFKWADDFIGKYKDRLNNEHRDDIVNFCYAIVEFESRNYKSSLDRLSKINLQHPLLRFRIRNYTLLNYYELNYYEQAFLMLDAYRHMLEKDKKVEISRKERYKTFLNICQKLLAMKSGYKKTEKDILKKNIQKNSVFMKQWLIEKIEEL